jgi:hypothetical protein
MGDKDQERKEERENLFTFYKQRRDAYNPVPMIMVCIVIGWISVYGVYHLVRQLVSWITN